MDKSKHALQKIAKRYGLRPDEYYEMYEEQGKACFMCFEPFSGSLPPMVDHCHSSGRVRKLLCSYCNTILGMAERKGNPGSVLRRAIEYIEVH